MAKFVRSEFLRDFVVMVVVISQLSILRINLPIHYASKTIGPQCFLLLKKPSMSQLIPDHGRLLQHHNLASPTILVGLFVSYTPVHIKINPQRSLSSVVVFFYVNDHRTIQQIY